MYTEIEGSQKVLNIVLKNNDNNNHLLAMVEKKNFTCDCDRCTTACCSGW